MVKKQGDTATVEAIAAAFSQEDARIIHLALDHLKATLGQEVVWRYASETSPDIENERNRAGELAEMFSQANFRRLAGEMANQS